MFDEKYKNRICYFKTSLCILASFTMLMISGCGDVQTEGQYDYQNILKADTKSGLKSAFGEYSSLLGIIRGAVSKYMLNPENPQNLGMAVGATQAFLFSEEYEFSNQGMMKHVPPEIKSDVVSQNVFNVADNTKETIRHVYTAVLLPVSSSLETKGRANVDKGTLNKLTQLLGNLSEEYKVLADENVDLKSIEAQNTVESIKNNLNEIQKLELVDRQ